MKITATELAEEIASEATVQREAALRTAEKLYRDVSNLILDLQTNQRPSCSVSGSLGIASDAAGVERQVFAWLHLAQVAELAKRVEA